MTGLKNSGETFFDVETWYRDDHESLAFIVLHGVGNHVRNIRSATTYEVISGRGVFMLDGDDCLLLVGPGDKVTVDVGQGYQDYGNLAMLARSTPPFNSAYVEILKNNIQ